MQIALALYYIEYNIEINMSLLLGTPTKAAYLDAIMFKGPQWFDTLANFDILDEAESQVSSTSMRPACPMLWHPPPRVSSISI